jgi:DNA-3-methyladenine glycosylase II
MIDYEKAYRHLHSNAVFRKVFDYIDPVELTVGGNVYFALLRSIVSQQLSTKAAATIFDRFLQIYPEKYPKAHQVVDTDIETMRSVGLSYQKANYIKNVAQFSLDNDLENYSWEGMTDEEIIQKLTSIKGVGKWTTEMILIFTLGRPDVFPIDDLGIMNAMKRLVPLENIPPKELKVKMLAIAELWQPHRTYASYWLWRYYEKSNQK